MTCDNGRPCQRCIKRSIGHLCHDERIPSVRRHQLLHENVTLSAVGSAANPSRFVPGTQQHLTFMQSKDPTAPTGDYLGTLWTADSSSACFAPAEITRSLLRFGRSYNTKN
ncbi:MAG: hypothetical protein BJ554DRAFT_1356 [Olpidium bornovanus]|uniref:Zn(2)-C6 fungal-type domain-containing protein n=1 Tax=Olpidium bornovanus TaxID=278681 RepID=A0A8H7ZSG6_9FUNG|nr:MAG: hypothetical protein BJ554DRAFT_1356 [Olpidium bornovanus]